MRFDTFVDTLVRRKYVAGGILGVCLLVSPLALRAMHGTYMGTSSVLMISEDPTHTLVPVVDLPVMIMSPDVLNPVREKFKLPLTVDDLRARLSIKATPRSAVVPISYRDANRTLARDVPNAIADASVSYFHVLAKRQYAELSTYLDRAALEQKQQISQLDQALQRASRDEPSVAAEDASSRLSQRLADLTGQRAAAFATLAADQAAEHVTANRPPELNAIVRNDTLASDPTVQTLRTTAGKDAAQLATAQAQYTEKYPGLPGLQAQVSSEQASLNAAEAQAMRRGPSSPIYSQTVLDHQHASAIVAADKARVTALDAQIGSARSDLGILPHAGVNVDDIRLQLAGARAAYAQIVLRQTQTKADQAQASSLASLVVIDRVIQAAPRIPAAVLGVLTALIVVTLSICGALLWDALDSGLRTPADVEDVYGRPLFGTIGSRSRR